MNKTRLHCSVSGNGPTVVLVHGYMAEHAYWNKLQTSLTTNHTVISVDLLGFGRSPKPRGAEQYTFENQARTLRATLTDLQANAPFTLVGHSMGALISAVYAYLFPADVRRLILSNMSIFIDPTETQQQLASTSRLYQTLLYRPEGRVLWPVIKGTLPLLRTKHGELRNMTRRHNHSSRQGALAAIEQTNAKLLLERLTVPTDLIIGLKDRAIYQKNITTISLPPNVTLHSVPTGHHTPVQQPEILTELITQTTAPN